MQTTSYRIDPKLLKPWIHYWNPMKCLKFNIKIYSKNVKKNKKKTKQPHYN